MVQGFVGKKPDFDLSAKLGPDAKWRKVGAGWTKDDGSGAISIKLDDFIVLGGTNKPEALYLFPVKEKA